MRAVRGVNPAPPDAASRFSSSRRNALFVVSLVVVLGALALRGTGWWRGDHGDLVDFVEGGRSILLGREIYADIPGVMPFNYPPFGAVVMVPLAMAGMPLAFPVMTALSLVSYVVIVVAVARAAKLDPRVATVVGLGGLALEPVFRTVVLGQVNLVLAALVVLDLLVVPARMRGVLIGVAAGIKLTPAVFGIYFLLRREWASAARCGAAFLATVVIGWALAPGSSPHYWLRFEWLQRFVTDAMVTQNQSLRAALVRGAGSAVPEAVVAALTVVVLGAGLWAAWRQVRAGADLAAILALASLTLVVSPISWTHHWIWVVPALLVLAAARKWVTVWAVGAVFFVAPMWFVGATSGGLTVLEVILSSAYLWLGVSAIGYLAVAPPLVLPTPTHRTHPSARGSLVDHPGAKG
jgi:alpha-1,2-mannosyltransferase